MTTITNYTDMRNYLADTRGDSTQPIHCCEECGAMMLGEPRADASLCNRCADEGSKLDSEKERART